MKTYLSGIQPTGLPHLGNYFGAIARHVEASIEHLMERFQSLIFGSFKGIFCGNL